MVYDPNQSIKLKDVHLSHLDTQTRYTAHSVDQKSLLDQVQQDRATLTTYDTFKYVLL